MKLQNIIGYNDIGVSKFSKFGTEIAYLSPKRALYSITAILENLFGNFSKQNNQFHQYQVKINLNYLNFIRIKNLLHYLDLFFFYYI